MDASNERSSKSTLNIGEHDRWNGKKHAKEHKTALLKKFPKQTSLSPCCSCLFADVQVQSFPLRRSFQALTREAELPCRHLAAIKTICFNKHIRVEPWLTKQSKTTQTTNYHATGSSPPHEPKFPRFNTKLRCKHSSEGEDKRRKIKTIFFQKTNASSIHLLLSLSQSRFLTHK